MRTPEQIKNCRDVLYKIIGPVAYIVNDAQVDAYMNAMQAQVNQLGEEQKHWSVKVRIKGFHDNLTWNQIEPESNQILAPISTMRTLCANALRKAEGQLLDMEITNTRNTEERYVFRYEGEDK